MMTAQYSDAQIMGILKQAEGGVPVSERCREQPNTIRVDKVIRSTSVQLRYFIVVIGVPPDHAADCRERAAQVVSDLFDGYLRFKPFGQLATFFEVLVTTRVLFYVVFYHTKAARWGGLVLLIIE